MSDKEYYEKFSRKDLQKMAKKAGIKANAKSSEIIRELMKEKSKVKPKAKSKVKRKVKSKAESKAKPRAKAKARVKVKAKRKSYLDSKEKEKESNEVRWFLGEGKFSIGIELYEDEDGRKGSPVVRGDNVRTFIKVYMRNLPNVKDADVVCQLFYRSGGANSGFLGVWFPTNGMVLKLQEVKKFALRWNWFIYKKPWLVKKGGGSLNMRYGGDLCVMYVASMLGGAGWTAPMVAKIGREMTKYLHKEYGTEGEKAAEGMIHYRATMTEKIQKYLANNLKHEIPCDEYDIDMWVGPCTSYNWFAPWDEKHPEIIPNMDPRTGDFWLEDYQTKGDEKNEDVYRGYISQKITEDEGTKKNIKPGGLYLRADWLDHPKRMWSSQERIKLARERKAIMPMINLVHPRPGSYNKKTGEYTSFLKTRDEL